MEGRDGGAAAGLAFAFGEGSVVFVRTRGLPFWPGRVVCADPDGGAAARTVRLFTRSRQEVVAPVRHLRDYVAHMHLAGEAGALFRHALLRACDEANGFIRGKMHLMIDTAAPAAPAPLAAPGAQHFGAPAATARSRRLAPRADDARALDAVVAEVRALAAAGERASRASVDGGVKAVQAICVQHWGATKTVTDAGVRAVRGIAGGFRDEVQEAAAELREAVAGRDKFHQRSFSALLRKMDGVLEVCADQLQAVGGRLDGIGARAGEGAGIGPDEVVRRIEERIAQLHRRLVRDIGAVYEEKMRRTRQALQGQRLEAVIGSLRMLEEQQKRLCNKVLEWDERLDREKAGRDKGEREVTIDINKNGVARGELLHAGVATRVFLKPLKSIVKRFRPRFRFWRQYCSVDRLFRT